MRALVIPCPSSASLTSRWGALSALPVGHRLQLAHLIGWIKEGGVEEVDVFLSDLRSARRLYPICHEMGANLHLCWDSSGLASHLAWIVERRDQRMLVIPEDFHPDAGSRLDLDRPPPVSRQAVPTPRFALYRSPQHIHRTLSQLAAHRIEPEGLEPILLTNQGGPGSETVEWSGASLIRDPVAYLEACARATRRPQRRPGHGLKNVRIGGNVQIAPTARIGRGARLHDCVVLPGTPIAPMESLHRVIAFGTTRIHVDSAECIDVNPHQLRWQPPRIRTPFLQRALAAALLVAGTPILALGALAVKLESRGPALFRQIRLGQDRRHRRSEEGQAQPVTLYKLRTMHLGAEAARSDHMGQNAYGAGPFFKLSGDPRVTAVGGLLRRLGIDELPQLFNVITGELALVGNRPLPLYEAGQLRQPWQRLRYDAPAGITGLWQVLGRSNLHWRPRQFLDNYYAIHRNAHLDTSILVRTLPAILSSKGDSW